MRSLQSPTIVLVHGEFAESASWNGVIDLLAAAGQRTVAAANPLRGLAADAGAVGDLVRSIEGPIVLVGHGYGGAVITGVVADDVTGLVFVAGYAPDAGESCFTLAQQFPGSTLGEHLDAVLRADETTDLSLVQAHFHAEFAADLPEREVTRLATTQRPITREALLEPAGPRPLWKAVPSRFLIAGNDRLLPATAQRFMAERACARRVLERPTASHAAPVSEPVATAELILEAARHG
ncbi:alpha/beta hydrolase [Solirubrobacter phytolaccae]|uniref:Alpha/beta hydrolase n=1 Tax=Solirubrobacter phytolaccae TaxID=1404360 RepID=A0A9X3N8X3_9ACTN|nr:alpha/beta fold hydrolase [Solirubrobacter phytolaccae]MDA0181948.1 alpha/beta hydrolase [Solirubrobacter phytolaccae]